MRYASLLAGMVLVLLAQSSPVATQPWNLPRPVLLNGCSENALIIAVKTCASSSSCASGLARFENVNPPYTICCVGRRWGILPSGAPYPAACRLRAGIPIQPPVVAPLQQR